MCCTLHCYTTHYCICLYGIQYISMKHVHIPYICTHMLLKCIQYIFIHTICLYHTYIYIYYSSLYIYTIYVVCTNIIITVIFPATKRIWICISDKRLNSKCLTTYLNVEIEHSSVGSLQQPETSSRTAYQHGVRPLPKGYNEYVLMYECSYFEVDWQSLHFTFVYLYAM